MVTKTSKEHLIVVKDGQRMLNATLRISHVPADAMGPAHKKYGYDVSDGMWTGGVFTKTDAFQDLLILAKENGWRVLQFLV